MPSIIARRSGNGSFAQFFAFNYSFCFNCLQMSMPSSFFKALFSSYLQAFFKALFSSTFQSFIFKTASQAPASCSFVILKLLLFSLQFFLPLTLKPLFLSIKDNLRFLTLCPLAWYL